MTQITLTVRKSKLAAFKTAALEGVHQHRRAAGSSSMFNALPVQWRNP